MKKIFTKNKDETIELGNKIGKKIVSPFTILLEGELASGKTTLTKGIAKGLGINKVINSPSFTIMKEYEKENFSFCHFDFYRMEKLGVDFDLEDYLSNSVSVIEWPYQVKELIPDNYLLIKINKINEEEREFIFEPHGLKYEEFIQCIH